MFRHEFRRTPLSAAVPLEGSDTVVGLRELESRQRREALQDLFGAANGVSPSAAAGKCIQTYTALVCVHLTCILKASAHCLLGNGIVRFTLSKTQRMARRGRQ